MSDTLSRSIAAQISADAYVRERLNPKPGDFAYLHLSDLLLALRKNVPAQENCHVLDFGCGGSPYRSLFGEVDYRGADVSARPGVHYEIGPDGTIPETSDFFDVVLSTQVLEHVPDPDGYIRECVRVLRPGGLLILSTHGSYEDHACPADYYRWTASGLAHLMSRFGLAVQTTQKLTTNARAVAFLIRSKLRLLGKRKSLLGIFFWIAGKAMNRFSAQFDRWCDAHFPECRVVEGGDEHTLYVAILIVARKKVPMGESA